MAHNADSSKSVPLLQLLHGGELPEPELRQLISVHFGHGSMRTPRLVEYHHDQQGEACLTMAYGRHGQLIGIHRGPGLTATSLAELLRTIEAELGATGTEVARTFMFSAVPTTTQWQYRDEVAIVPVPQDAPRPQQIIGDHPFVLEVRYPKSVHFIVGQQRATRLTRQWELLLCLLMGWGIHGTPRYATHNWSIVVTNSDPLTMDSQFLQQGYFATLPEVLSGEFSATAAPAIAIVEDTQFFSPRGISADSVLSAPACLVRALDTFRDLPATDQAQFLRACYWFQLSERQWALSHSASYVSLVQGVECLLPSDGSDRCPTCGRPQEGPTKAFSHFVETHAQGTSKADRAAFYSLRSTLTHGGQLLEGDQELAFAGLQPRMWEQREIHGQMSRVARLALINYLLSSL